MDDDLFAPAWIRLDRADEHRKRMSEIWNDYIADHPFTPSLTGYGNGTFLLTVHADVPPPAGLAVATGEWLYNVRAGLDYIMWATAAHESGAIPPPNEQLLQYPIYETPKEWKNNLRRLAGLSDHHRVMLNQMQPFNSDPDANFLRWINHLARIDRHRHLNHVTAYLAVIEPVVRVPDGCRVSLQWGDRVLRDGRADVVRYTVEPWEPGMQVEVNPRMGVDPEIEAWADSAHWRKIDYSERFKWLQIFVYGEIATYEYDCTGQSRKSHLLTDAFRAECDARRDPLRQTPQRPHIPTEWSSPRSGRVTTRNKFRGTDFPSDGPGERHRQILKA